MNSWWNVIIARRTVCPTCDCGYNFLVNDLKCDINRHPILTISKTEIDLCIYSIQKIQTLEQFDLLRKILRERLGVTFHLNGRWQMRVDKTPWICQSIWSRIKNASERLFPQEEIMDLSSPKGKLLVSILDRGSLFDS